MLVNIPHMDLLINYKCLVYWGYNPLILTFDPRTSFPGHPGLVFPLGGGLDLLDLGGVGDDSPGQRGAAGGTAPGGVQKVQVLPSTLLG